MSGLPDLRGKVAVVTGGGRSGEEMSIGRAISLTFAREGGKNFDADSSRVANKRTADFLAKHLYT